MESKLTPLRQAAGGENVDRYIPNRGAMDIDVASFNVLKSSMEHSFSAQNFSTPVKDGYRRQLAQVLSNQSGTPPSSQKILAFRNKPPAPFAPTNRLGERPEVSQKSEGPIRLPFKVLDAPALSDDYYLNLLDWNCHNVLAVGLGSSVHLHNATTGEVKCLWEEEEEEDNDSEYVSSVAWAPDGNHVAVGFSESHVEIWSVSPVKKLRALYGHSARVGSLAWKEHTLSTGSRDHTVMNHDVRIRQHVTSTLSAHVQEVCGLRWSPSGRQLASGGNDNLVCIWDAASASSSSPAAPLQRLTEHTAAVKALAWCPFQSNLLATGGGSADGYIRFWNVNTGSCLNRIQTGSQVSSLVWNKWQREILSSHGFNGLSMKLWQYPSLCQLAEFHGHTSRILNLAQSPDGCTVASLGGDETLRFWKAFDSPARSVRGSKARQQTHQSGNWVNRVSFTSAIVNLAQNGNYVQALQWLMRAGRS